MRKDTSPDRFGHCVLASPWSISSSAGGACASAPSIPVELGLQCRLTGPIGSIPGRPQDLLPNLACRVDGRGIR